MRRNPIFEEDRLALVEEIESQRSQLVEESIASLKTMMVPSIAVEVLKYHPFRNSSSPLPSLG